MSSKVMKNLKADFLSCEKILEQRISLCTVRKRKKMKLRLIFHGFQFLCSFVAMQIVLNGIFSIGIVCYAVSSVILLIGISEVSWCSIDRPLNLKKKYCFLYCRKN